MVIFYLPSMDETKIPLQTRMGSIYHDMQTKNTLAVIKKYCSELIRRLDVLIRMRLIDNCAK